MSVLDVLLSIAAGLALFGALLCVLTIIYSISQWWQQRRYRREHKELIARACMEVVRHTGIEVNIAPSFHSPGTMMLDCRYRDQRYLGDIYIGDDPPKDLLMERTISTLTHALVAMYSGVLLERAAVRKARRYYRSRY